MFSMNFFKLFIQLYIFIITISNSTQSSSSSSLQSINSKNTLIPSSLFYRNNTDNNQITRHNRMTKRNAFSIKKQNPNQQRYVIESVEKPAINISQQRPRFTLSRNINLPIDDPSAYKCTPLDNIQQQYSLKCENNTRLFRDKIIFELNKSVSIQIKDEPNYYNVNYNNGDGDGDGDDGDGGVNDHANIKLINHRKIKININSTINAAVCLLINSNVRTIKRKDWKFNDYQKIAKLLPTRKMIDRKFMGTRSCVIISSAGSLAKANLGKFIDSHDIVMRFNHAPVEGYQLDVGRKTTIRVVNSQVVSKGEFNFLESPLFQNITIAAWDPGKYNGTLLDWIRTPDFNLFRNYEKFMEKWPHSNFHLIHPKSIWNLWKTLQIFHKDYVIRKNPPSSGFIGLALLLPVCTYVDVIEYIPSTRLNGRCHYYSDEINPACTFGAWHPLAAEKLMTYKMNSASDYSVFQNGIIRIFRPQKKICDKYHIKI